MLMMLTLLPWQWNNCSGIDYHWTRTILTLLESLPTLLMTSPSPMHKMMLVMGIKLTHQVIHMWVLRLVFREVQMMN